ncbi:hypothetical protein ACRALDRAFT_1062133 [Sodiomyces alcalophilus JCM 7366]|uniref:uncharacterized protein n=1 Tax=Sodiomyces alcalophilus JCM 7366 TaxID=591952 RepID=UPI0039B4F0BC
MRRRPEIRKGSLHVRPDKIPAPVARISKPPLQRIEPPPHRRNVPLPKRTRNVLPQVQERQQLPVRVHLPRADLPHPPPVLLVADLRRLPPREDPQHVGHRLPLARPPHPFDDRIVSPSAPVQDPVDVVPGRLDDPVVPLDFVPFRRPDPVVPAAVRLHELAPQPAVAREEFPGKLFLPLQCEFGLPQLVVQFVAFLAAAVQIPVQLFLSPGLLDHLVQVDAKLLVDLLSQCHPVDVSR